MSGSRTFDTQDLPQHELTIRKNMSPPPARARARAAWSRLPPVRKIGKNDFRINRNSVGDEYEASFCGERGNSDGHVFLGANVIFSRAPAYLTPIVISLKITHT